MTGACVIALYKSTCTYVTLRYSLTYLLTYLLTYFFTNWLVDDLISIMNKMEN